MKPVGVSLGHCQTCGDYCPLRDGECTECRHGVEKRSFTLWCKKCERFSVVSVVTRLCAACSGEGKRKGAGA